MAKVRIFEWAKQNKKQSSEIVKKLNQAGHKVRNHTSVIEEEVLNTLFINGKDESVAAAVEKKEKPEKKVVEEVVVKKEEPKKEVAKKEEPKRENQTNTRPAQNNNRPGQSNNRPTQNNNRPGQSNNRPGQNNNNRSNQSGGQNRDGQNNGRPGQYNNNRPGQSNNRPGQYNNNRPGQGGGQNRDGQNNGRPGQYNNRPGQNNGKPGGNDNGNRRPYQGRPAPEKKEEAPVETKKPTTKKKQQNAGRKKYDRFQMFDKEKVENVNDGKTKTQLKKEAREERQKEKALETTIVQWNEEMTVAIFAQKIDIPVTDVIAKLFELGIMSTVNQTLSLDVAEVLSSEYNVEIKEDEAEADLDLENLMPDFDKFEKKTRPPVVTIMGHVDHGKTTLLDYLRNSKVADKEAGGITQHIGAYQIVTKDDFKITFLDTPGHEAFTAMRARGADVTDISILVVAADDGIMPQTVEAINHIKASKKPMIVAITKIDKPESNYDKILGELAENEIMPEEWGGEVPVVKLSALTGEGIDDLLEYIKVIADMHEYEASFEGNGVGTVLEANLDKGKGPVATILLQEGKLKLKDAIVIGDTWGNVRVLQDEYGKRYKEIDPSMPVEITGLKDVPQAGDKFFVADSIKEAQTIGEKRATIKQRKDRGSSKALSLEELNQMIESGDMKEVPIIIKADTQGSAEALASSLEKIEVSGVKVRVVSKGVGAINESDVLLATANKTIMIGFNVRPDAGAKKTIEKEKINLITNNIIYKIIEEVEDSMSGMREKKYTEDVIGHATVTDIFKITGVGKVAGAMVNEGKITSDCKMRLVRDGIVLYDGEIGQLKRYTDDAKEVIQGQDCGISFKDYSDLKKGDELEAYKVEEILE